MKKPIITIISDCSDDNAKARLLTVASIYFPGSPTNFIGVPNDLAAAGNIIDIVALTSKQNQPSIIMVNVAPRHNHHHENGSPFCHIKINQTLIFSTVGGYTLSLLKKFYDFKIFTIDIKKSLISLRDELYLFDKGIFDRDIIPITQSQFRSLYFLPLVAHAFWQNKKIVTEIHPLGEIPNCPFAIWWQDIFGNLKTTLNLKDIAKTIRKKEILTLKSKGKEYSLLFFSNGLASIPKNQLGLTAGSSGYGVDPESYGYYPNCFLEIQINGGNAAKELKLSVGDIFELY